MTTDFLVPDLATVAIECVVFAAVLAIVGRFALPRWRAVVDEQQRRSAETQAALAGAEAQRDEALAQARQLLVDARRQARQIIDRGHVKHDRLVEQGRREGQAEYEWRVARAVRREPHPVRAAK